jgi:SAM-dependent methyltransferase
VTNAGHEPDRETPASEEEGATEVWERLYNERGPRWSGRPNQRLVEVTSDLASGRALDLGCGEGGDAVWLAQRGWEVTAVDISPTAVARLTAFAEAEGVRARIHTQVLDLAVSFPDAPVGGWDLVSAQFFQSPIDFPRGDILRRGVSVTAPGGMLLVVEHGEAPIGSNHHDAVFPTVADTLAELALPAGEWAPVRVERTSREAPGPDGQVVEFVDNVLALRRVAAGSGV